MTLELLLSCLEPVVLAEQNFCLAFFKMDSKVSDAPPRVAAAARTKTQKQVQNLGLNFSKVLLLFNNIKIYKMFVYIIYMSISTHRAAKRSILTDDFPIICMEKLRGLS